jgi:RNA polymerase sigma-70 factor (ECF subfamily)
MQRDHSTAAGWVPTWNITMTRPDAAPIAAPRTDDLRACDDAALVQAFLGGRREAFDVIVERHRRQVYQLCYRFAGNHEDAADLAQDVFIRAFRGLKSFKGQASLGTWLYRIGVNVSLNRAAVRKPVVEPIEPDRHVDTHAQDPLDGLLQDEHGARVRAAIRRLPPKQRATVILRVYHEMPHEEIARTLGSSVGAVKANFFHALASLRRLMKSGQGPDRS